MASAAEVSVSVVKAPDTAAKNDFYVGNRAPLLPSPLIKLPIGAIKPQGWLRKQLLLEADGFTGHLYEVSKFLKEDGNAWLSPTGEGHSGWEELPYWLKGYGDLGYVLGDERIIKDSRRWLDATIASQRPDGYFGPRSNLTNAGTPQHRMADLWPNMVMLMALQSYYEYTGDKRVPELMAKYFRWEMGIPEADFLPPFWQQQRAADNLSSVYWLYNLTGEEWLLNLGEKIHKHTAPWSKGVANWHGVNISQSFRGPAVFYQQAKDPSLLEATENDLVQVMSRYGNVPGGLYGADENCREGYSDPRQAAETCTMVEMMFSDEMLLKITGDVAWADRCEEIAFNSLPASMTADLKALRYLTAPNQILSDRRSKSPGVQNGGPMMLFDPRDHRCCQHNVAHGWPYFAEHLWMATPDNGLAAVLYAASTVKAKVGDGTEVTIAEETHYPFDEAIELKLSTPKKVRFPLYLRLPDWCSDPALRINGSQVAIKPVAIRARESSYVRVDREWADGDTIRLRVPMTIRTTTYQTNKDSVAVSRGPLTFSLKIGEKIVRVGGTDKWPAIEIHPTGPWNYGLVLPKSIDFSIETVEKPWPKDDQPFVWDAAPIELKAKAKKIPAWQMDPLGLVGLLQQSPVKSSEPVETVTLIPMGCARLRISQFPVIGEGPNAHQWVAPPPRDQVSASYCYESDTTEALNDGRLPKSSSDNTIPRFTWWEHKGTSEWVEYTFSKPRTISQTEVYWFDDTGRGQCRVPKSWHAEWLDGQTWRPVKNTSDYEIAKDRFNKVTFEPVTTAQVRVVVQLQSGLSGGVFEWRVK